MVEGTNAKMIEGVILIANQVSYQQQKALPESLISSINKIKAGIRNQGIRYFNSSFGLIIFKQGRNDSW